MVQIIKWQKYLVISLFLILLNILLPSGLKFFAGILYLGFFGLAFGNWLFIKNSTTCKLFFGLFFVLSLASLIGTAFFYFSRLSNFAHLATLISIPLLILFLVINKPLVIEWPNRIFSKVNSKIFILTLAYLIFTLATLYLIYSSRTDISLRSPWEVIPKEIFLLYFLATFTLLSILVFTKSRASLILIIIHFFISFSVVLITYQIGFDYDPFIHRVNENLILNSGTLLPKPFYYIGQYSLLIFLQKLLSLPMEWLDKLLVPILSAIYIPYAIYHSFKDNFKIKINYLLFLIPILLVIPYTNFVLTTPQALANVFFLVTLFLSLYFLSHPKVSFWPLSLLALTTLSIHPLAGIPCFFFIILIFLYHRFKQKLPKLIHKGIFWEVVIIASVALPVAFLISSKTLAQLKVGLNSNWLIDLLRALSASNFDIFYRPFISIYDLVYNFNNNIISFLLILIAIGLIYLIRQKKFKNFSIYLILSLILLVNYFFLVAGLSFFNLLSYEQQTYPIRILEMSFYSLLPFLIFALYLVLKKVFVQKRNFILLFTFLISLALTNSFYLSYPRVDKIVENHGFSTSATDLKTVNFLEQLNQGQPYISLASQPVSAAAIKELGFKYYYNNYYFYPVPTGERLYQLYEDLAYGKEKTADVIATTRYLTGVNTVYFILNDYWFDAKNLILQHKESADHWYAIDGKNFIFEYVN